MYILVTNKQSGELAPEFRQMHQLRHDVFVEKFRWEELRRADGLDIDRFDHDHAAYLLDVSPEGVVYGCVRLTPAWAPNVTYDLFGEKLAIEPPNRHGPVLEVSRACLDPALSKAESSLAWARLTMATVLISERFGFDTHVTMTRDKYLAAWVQAGVKSRPLSLPEQVNGYGFLAMATDLTPGTIVSLESAFDVARPDVEVFDEESAKAVLAPQGKVTQVDTVAAQKVA